MPVTKIPVQSDTLVITRVANGFLLEEATSMRGPIPANKKKVATSPLAMSKLIDKWLSE